MTAIEVLSQPFWQRVGMSLVHFFWQGLAIAVLVSITVRLFKLQHGSPRYSAFLLALLIMLACPFITFSVLDVSPRIHTPAGKNRPAQPAETTVKASLPIRESHHAESLLLPAPARLMVQPIQKEERTFKNSTEALLDRALPWALGVWIVGVLLLGCRLLLGYVGLCRWRCELKPLPPHLAMSVRQLAAQVGLPGFERVFLSSQVRDGVAVGLFRPIVLIPVSLLTHIPSDMLQAIIAHELAHIRRLDLWVNLAQRLMETLLFFHPAVWWLSHHLRIEREFCCDDLAVKLTGKRITYASTLEAVGRSRLVIPAALALGLRGNTRSMLNRVRHILGLAPTESRFWIVGLIGVALLIPLILLALFAGGVLKIDGSNGPGSAQDLLDKIIASEEKIDNIQLHITCTLPMKTTTITHESEWGYDQGKEFFQTRWNKTRNGSNAVLEEKQSQNTFDGNALWSLQITPGWSFSKGSISATDSSVFSGKMSFNTLLGCDSLRPLCFGESLAQAESAVLRDQVERVDGHPCYVVEAMASDHSHKTLAWVDFERDYRILKLERYTDQGDSLFAHLQMRLDRIKLKQIEGIWLPVQGERSYPWNAQLKAQRLEVDIDSIKLNQGIPPEMFSIDFPEGCIVENELTEKKYTVGDVSEQEAALSDADWKARMRGLSVEELIAFLIHAKPRSTWQDQDVIGDARYASSGYGWENVKCFAPIHRLIEIGLPALEPLSAELGRTDDPWLQSRLAFTLRAINNPQAVPALIGALERCALGLDEVRVEGDGTELDEFLKLHQMDPSGDELQIGRPVREITLALERLTCHTEGHEHFFLHNAKGERLDHLAQGITPETRDRQREDWRRIAHAWRQWWQQNRDRLGSQAWSPEMLPMPIEESANRWGAYGGMLMPGGHAGANLSLAIVPNVADSGQAPNLSKEEFKRYANDLATRGPWLESPSANSFQWVRIQGNAEIFKGMPLSQYQGNTYILLCTREAHVLQPIVEDERKWKLDAVQIVDDAAGLPAIRVRFDDIASDLLYKLSQANLNNYLAVRIGQEVQCTPIIKSPIKNEIIIAGQYTEQEANKLVEELHRGVVRMVGLPSGNY
jgi:beta-lactamase regulating signal transducer with metallopeptidase domain